MLQGRCLVCFGSALDAVRFCHAAQVALLFQRWPSDCAAVAGPTELTPDNRPLFAGPRIAMAVHTTPAHECAAAICHVERLGIRLSAPVITTEKHSKAPFCIGTHLVMHRVSIDTLGGITAILPPRRSHSDA